MTTCGCKEWLEKHLADNPPNFHNFFIWSVDLHNAVNAKLAKPMITHAEASDIWRLSED